MKIKKIQKIKSFFSNYKNKSLLIRNYVRLLSFASVLIFLFSIYIFNITKKKINGEYLQTIVKDTQKIAALTDNALNDLFLIAPQIAASENFKFLLFSDKVEALWSESVGSSIKEITDTYPYLHNCVHSVELYFENSDLKYSTHSESRGFSSEKTQWYNEYKKMKALETKIIFRKHNDSYPYLMTYIYKCNNFGYNGAIAINVDLRKLEKIVDKGLSENQSVYILQNDKIIYKKNLDKFMEKISDDEQLYDFIRNSENKEEIKEIDGEKYTLYRTKSESFDWDYFCVNKLQGYDEKMNIESYLLKIVFILVLFIALGIAFVITVSSYRPVNDLVKFIDETEKRDLSSLNGKEIRYIAHKISVMINENTQLKEELDKSITSLNETELAALKAQMNPHFLFNTLNIINLRLSEAYGIDYKGSDMLENLSSILRYTLKTQGNTASVTDEITNEKYYSVILYERYNHNFEIVFDIDERLKNFKVPILVFQPLIENAVYHGISKKTSGNNLIKVTGKITENNVVFTVFDNGNGMSEEKLEETRTIINRKEPFSSKHIGLANINKRIKLLYGEAYGVEVTSTLKIGTTVTLILPKE